jgi:hypothetical protein
MPCRFCDKREYFESECFLVPSEKRRQAAALQSLAEVLSKRKLLCETRRIFGSTAGNSGVGCVFCMNGRECFESEWSLVYPEKRRRAAALQSLADILLRHKLDDGSKADKPLPGKFARHGRFVKQSNRKNKHLFVAQRIKAGDGYQS